MAQTLSINEAQTIISDLLDEVWEAEKPAKKPAFETYMNVDSLNRGEHVNYRTAGVGKLQERQELEDIDYDDIAFGEKQTVKDKKWGRGFRVSEEVLEDLADSGGNADGDLAAKLGTYTDVVRRWKRSALWTADQECADLLLNGTSTAAQYVGRDSLALFSASHVTLKNPVITQSNLATHATISTGSLESMMTTLETQYDDRGDFLDDDGGYILVHGPALKWRVKEILRTTGEVGTANNTINTLKDEDITPVQVKYLGTSYAGYFLLKKGVHSLTWLWRKKPQFKREGDFDAVAMKYRVTMRGVRFFKDYRGAVGDMGS